MYPYPERPDICWDSDGYVMALVAWHGGIVVRQRRLRPQDSLKLAQWLVKTTEEIVMSRVITVVLEIQDQASAKEFWDAHVGRRNIHGCRVVALADGDKVKECETLEAELDDDVIVEDDDSLEIL